MRHASTHIAADVQALMVETRKRVAERLLALVKAAPLVAALGQDRASRIAVLLARHDGTHLGLVSSEVREAIIEARPENKLGRWTLWQIIDAIGHLGDCAPGRWPYFTDEKRRTSLQWAGEELDQAESDVMGVRFAAPAAELAAA